MKKSQPSSSVSVGTVCQHKYKGVVYEMTIVETAKGVGYKLGDQIYDSPTAAAKAVVGRHAFVNGRKFWHLD